MSSRLMLVFSMIILGIILYSEIPNLKVRHSFPRKSWNLIYFRYIALYVFHPCRLEYVGPGIILLGVKLELYPAIQTPILKVPDFFKKME